MENDKQAVVIEVAIEKDKGSDQKVPVQQRLEQRLEKQSSDDKKGPTLTEIQDKLDKAEQLRQKATAEKRESLKDHVEKVERVKAEVEQQTQGKIKTIERELSKKLEEASHKREEIIQEQLKDV